MFPNYEFRSASISIISFSSFNGCPARFHNHLEIGYVIKGELKVIIENKTYSLKAGDLYICFPNIVHAVSPSEASCIVIVADSSLFSNFYEALSKTYPENPILRRKELPSTVDTIINRIFEISNLKSKKPYDLLASTYINAVLGEVFLKINCIKRNADTNLLQKLMMYLLNHYTEDLNLEDISKTLGYSKWYISKIISNTFGFNFRTLVNSYRVGLAENLLLTTKQNILHIALECGFKNQSSFNRIFLSFSGMTPSEFRERGGAPNKKPEIFYAKG